MTDATNPLSAEDMDARMPTELEVLKDRARKMGITFSNNIGLEALRQKVADKQEGKAETPEAPAPAASLFSLAPTPTSIPAPTAQIEPEGTKEETIEALQAKLSALTGSAGPGVIAQTMNPQAVNPLADAPEAPVRKRTLQQMMREEQTKLIRIRIQNLDPKKKDLHGEIITVANEYLGTIKKFVPYGEVTDEGYHVPYCIYEFLKSKRFLNIRTTRDRVTKQVKVEHNMALEYSIEVLPQLTRDELNRLAASQAAAGSLN